MSLLTHKNVGVWEISRKSLGVILRHKQIIDSGRRLTGG
ncbi:hypothetical protein J2S55_001330 [Streptosporangium brasiliense]|uniref:Uncharacterized protein n=1 Tax=Streptosporangium brasiliense TaxID=47480 RepID=A0ABT9QZI3_9ACTN|nr:hypothetical protein [Streptosporangium brasiliense]